MHDNHRNNKNKRNTDTIIGIVYWTAIAGAVMSFFFWNNIEAFFASTPQSKCEAFLSKNNDTYCKVDGTKGSRTEDIKRSCDQKNPYFIWESSTSECKRVQYTSKQECIDSGKEGYVTHEGIPFGTRCLDDGTWETYDPDHEDYRIEQMMDDYEESQMLN